MKTCWLINHLPNLSLKIVILQLIKPFCMNPITIITTRWKNKRVETVVIIAAILTALSLLTWQQRRRNSHTLTSNHSINCHFPAIFNFGDSNSDTGAASAAFGSVESPNGGTFFGEPTGRLCDGRLVIDFFAEKLRLPYISAYLDSIESNFNNGANFAASGSTVKPVASASPLHLGIQLSQFHQLKARSIKIYNMGSSNSKTISWVKSRLPRTEYFSKALYIMDIGQNDLDVGLTTMAEDQVEKSIPDIIDQIALSVESLYQQGARFIWIHCTGPIGCLPSLVINRPPKPENSDSFGCIKSYNEVAQEFNKQLKDKVSQLRTRLKYALLVYVDIYTAKYSLISKAKELGYVDHLGYCCGNRGIYCGETAIVNGTEVYGASCKNSSQYISWDGIHNTESANRWIADHIMDGSLSDPPVPIFEACQRYVHIE